MQIVEGPNPLAERLAEVIEEFCECNTVTVEDVLEALEYTHACVERYAPFIDALADRMNRSSLRTVQ